MISPQETGAKPDAVSITLTGYDIAVIRACLLLYKLAPHCMFDDPGCDGLTIMEDQRAGLICRDCGEAAELYCFIEDLLHRLKKEWDTR